MSDELLKVTFKVLRDGKVVEKSIEGAELEKWKNFNLQVCTFAYAHNANPDWTSIKWEEITHDKEN